MQKHRLGIARHRWRARIETFGYQRGLADAHGSPAIDGGRGLKQRRQPGVQRLHRIARHRWRARIETC